MLAVLDVHLRPQHPQPLQVAEWLAYRHTQLSPLMDDKLVRINDWLQTQTFLTGSTLTLADLVLYAAVQPAVVSECHRQGLQDEQGQAIHG